MNKTLAIAGITGHTGKFLLQELIRNHYEGTIRCLVRSTSDTFLLDQSGLKIEKNKNPQNGRRSLLFSRRCYA